MKVKICQKIAQLLLVLLGLSFISFALMYITPGDPAQHRLIAQGIVVTPEVLEQTREEMGLNQPFIRQYFTWLGQALVGNLGISYRTGHPVTAMLGQALSHTVLLAGISFGSALGMAIFLSVLSLLKRGRIIQYIIRICTTTGNALPNFLLATVFMYLFCIRWNIFPIIAGGTWKGLFLPVFSLSFPLFSLLTKQLYAQMTEEMEKPYVQAALARGMKERTVVCSLVLRHALIIVIPLLGLTIGGLFGGSVVIENLFGWPGIGDMVMDAISARDYPVIQAFVLVSGGLYVIISFVLDLLYLYLSGLETSS